MAAVYTGWHANLTAAFAGSRPAAAFATVAHSHSKPGNYRCNLDDTADGILTDTD